jgi:hypothetical protein
MLVAAILILLYTLFIFWYGGSGKPITIKEMEMLFEQMKENAGEFNKPDNNLINDFRELCKSDDGKEFYMVNLIRYKKEIVNGIDPLVENKKYIKKIFPLLLKYGGHPVFMSSYMGRMIHPEGNDDWNEIVIIRYRSRKDLLKMAVDGAKLNLAANKFAAIEKTQVFPVKASISSVPIKLLATLLLIFSLGCVNAIKQNKKYTAFVKDFHWLSSYELIGWDAKTDLNYCVFYSPNNVFTDQSNTILLKSISEKQMQSWLEMNRDSQ